MKKKVLWIGHGNIQTGFGRVAQNVLAYLRPHWDIVHLAIGYTGDPHDSPYRMYPAGNQGDQWGLNRLETVYRLEKPDVLMILMEPWNILNAGNQIIGPYGQMFGTQTQMGRRGMPFLRAIGGIGASLLGAAIPG